VLQVGNFCSRSSCRDGPARGSVNQLSTDKSIFYRFPKAGQHRKQSERIAAFMRVARGTAIRPFAIGDAVLELAGEGALFRTEPVYAPSR
jgi:hypothetical protein